MPHYFFDTDDGIKLIRDEDGLDLPDREAARHQALAGLRDMAKDHLPDGDRRDFVVKVRTVASVAVYGATLSLHGGWAD